MKISPSTILLLLIPFTPVSADEAPKKGKANPTRTAVLTNADTNVRVSKLCTSKTNHNVKSANAKLPVTSANKPNNEVPIPDDFVDASPQTETTKKANETKKTNRKTSSLPRSTKQKQRAEKRSPKPPLMESTMSACPAGPIGDPNGIEEGQPVEQVAMHDGSRPIYRDSSRDYGIYY